MKMGNSLSLLQRGIGALGALAIVGLGVGVAAGPAIAAASGSVALHLSNRSAKSAACKANNVDHIYVTIADVKAHRSGKGMAGFVSLTAGAPEQFDLLFSSSEASENFEIADCPIVALGGTGLLPGKYQQIRLITVDNGATDSQGKPIIAPTDNKCASLTDTTYNCVDAGGMLFPLTIPSGSHTGIKIPASQVKHGGFTIQSDQGLDLDVDVDACRSLVVHGGGTRGRGKHKHQVATTYSFKPVLHTGEVSLQPIIAGSVVVGSTSGPGETVTPGTTVVPNAAVWLEAEPSSANVTVGNPSPSANQVPLNNVQAETTTDSAGNFAFCPVPDGNYDIVADAQNLPSATNPSDATITTGVSVTGNGGPNNLVIPLLEGSAAAPTLDAQVTTTSTPPPGAGDDIAFRGSQGFGMNSNQAPIPLYTGTSASPVTTTSTPSSGCILPVICPVGTNCACFSMVVPADNPVTGAVGGPYTSGSGTANYSLSGSATQTGTTTADCVPSELITNPEASPLPEPTLSFTGCAP